MSRFETPFADRLFRRVRAIDSRLVVGIDPFIERFPEDYARVATTLTRLEARRDDFLAAYGGSSTR